MIFTPLHLPGAFVIEMQKIEDERGFFARSWCAREADAQGLVPGIAQCNVSFNINRGTIRGIHFQTAPRAEAKLVRCTRGSLFDVAVDLRTHSATFLKWVGVELTQDNGKMLYLPKGFGHGFQTLMDETEIFYQMSEFYEPGASRGVRWNDPLLQIQWPLPVAAISEKDRTYPDARREQFWEEPTV